MRNDVIKCTMSRAQDKENPEFPTGIEPTTLCTQNYSWRAGPYTQGSCLIYINVQWNFDITKDLGTGKNLFAIPRFRCIEVFYSYFYYYWGKENSFIPRTLVYRGSLHRGSTLLLRIKSIRQF